MGIFSKLASGAKDNQHIANGVSAVLRALDDYDQSKDDNVLIFAAYITRLAILDTFEKSGYNVAYICYSNINGKLTRITWLQASLMTYGRITNYIEYLDSATKELIESILDRGEAFVIIDKKMSHDEKKPFTD